MKLTVQSKKLRTLLIVASLLLGLLNGIQHARKQELWITEEQLYETGNGTEIKIVTTLESSGKSREWHEINYIKY